MYESLPQREQPRDDTLLWRYMDLAKFIAIVETQSLFFPRVTTLQDRDPFEGHPPKSFVDWLKANPPSMVGQVDPNQRAKRTMADLANIRDARKYICASCWHANVGESAAMWSLYSRSGDGGDGIALRVTFADLRKGFAATEQTVHGGMVRYVDFDTYAERFNLLSCASLKRKSFEHEREFRLLLIDNSTPELGPGVPVSVDLAVLLGDVMGSPTMPEWLVDLVRRLLHRYAYKFSLSKSTLLDGPSYYELAD